jgi:hypothetical protein
MRKRALPLPLFSMLVVRAAWARGASNRVQTRASIKRPGANTAAKNTYIGCHIDELIFTGECSNKRIIIITENS